MISLLISIILFVLTLFGVKIPYWVVSGPAMIAASFSLWLFMKAEFEYLKNLKNKPEETNDESR